MCVTQSCMFVSSCNLKKGGRDVAKNVEKKTRRMMKIENFGISLRRFIFCYCAVPPRFFLYNENNVKITKTLCRSL